MIEKIVNDVSNKLNSTESNDFADFVGIEDHMKNMNSFLKLESEEVIMVGIWGPSGVGKTTIGRALFSQLSCQFLASIFIDKTKENYTRANSDDYNTKLYLQTQFLSEILDQKDIKIHCLGAVKERLGHKKVLVVFDDVDDQVLLKSLVGKTTWFGPGSRIIVTSKDRELLRDCGIESDGIYEVGVPSKEVAFQMFCRCAFGQDSPPDGFMDIAIKAAGLTEDLPLCLSVLGSSLRGIKKEEWADRLPKLRNSMAGKIEKTLRDSYDRLKEEDKAIFRHIACLFNHKPREYVIRLLEDSKLNVDVGLVTLAERCLIQISEDKIIRMHDFLQKMGREIVRQQCLLEPGACQFLLDSKEIRDVLVDGTGTKCVLGIFLNLSEIEDTFSINKKAFRRMKNLRFLSIYGFLREDKEVILQLQGGEDLMWRQLRLLEWWGCSMRCMPPNFRPENLVELRMPDSHLEKLWEGVHLLKGLRKMDLRRSKMLKEIPDLSKATNLEELYLGDCWRLKSIPPSIQNLNRLRKLDMKRCKNLQGLPTNIHLESLYSLNLSGCLQLRTFPQISRNVSSLFLDETEIEEVPGWIEDISGLNYILMNGCSNLKYISPNISKLKDLEVIFFSNSDSLTEESDSPSAVARTTDNIHTQLADASSSCNWKHDVYLSFRGEDVRRTLISYLYHELSRKGITTYKDTLVRGQNLAPELQHGIRESRVAIVVLSNNYASSTWCLEELVEIMKCRKEIGLKVIPIYYGGDPVQIRKQIRDLGKTFKKMYTVDKQQKWVRSLTVVNQLLGYQVRDWDSEAEMIERIVDDISFGLTITPKKLPDVVGIEMLPRIRNTLDQETEKTLIVRYAGLNGNKKALFRHIACFLNNETYENVMRLLEESELDVGLGLKILFDQSLIQISEKRVISMHDVLQKIGRDRVLEPLFHQPAKRQFLMDTSQGCDVLIDQTGTENVFGISFKVAEMEETLRRNEKFKGLKKLQFMRMCKESLYGKEVRLHLVKGLHSLRHRLNTT
uniref:ADP-ribosyl cyclase/cyclic ADP-ribose hydrolase n=1 Tax=Noccaea caerulescens TaxID=107243 RepID=A0A1J3G457_NOCCA